MFLRSPQVREEGKRILLGVDALKSTMETEAPMVLEEVTAEADTMEELSWDTGEQFWSVYIICIYTCANKSSSTRPTKYYLTTNNVAVEIINLLFMNYEIVPLLIGVHEIARFNLENTLILS